MDLIEETSTSEDLEEPEKVDPNFHANEIKRIFEERCKQQKKTQMKEMVLSDQLGVRDPQCLSEFSQDIYLNMRQQEEEHRVQPFDYLKSVQNEIKDTQRAFLIEWIIDVHRKFRLVPETLYVAQFIIDKYLSLKRIESKQLHLLGVTTLLISMKYEEIYPPDLRDLLHISENKFNKQQVTALEQDILQTMDFKVTSPSHFRFLQRFARLNQRVNDDEVFHLAQYILEISLLDASFLRFLPSQLAAASLILAAKRIKNFDCWSKEMEQFSGYSAGSLTEVVKEVKLFVVEINPKFISVLKYKFSKPQYNKVANYSLKF